jgi:hypothetical protein
VTGCNLPNIHIFHAHNDIVVFVEKRTVKGDNIVGMATVHDLQFADYTLAHLFLGLDVDNLSAG